MRFIRNVEDDNGDLVELIYYCSWLCFSTESDAAVASLTGGAWPCLDSELTLPAVCRGCGRPVGASDSIEVELELHSSAHGASTDLAERYFGSGFRERGRMARTPKVPVTPSLLSWARELSGYSLTDIAKRVGVKDATRVAAWEAGDDQPTLAQVRKLAASYGRTPAFFFLKTPPPSDLPKEPDFRGLTVRGSLSPKLRREMRLAAERRASYIELHGADDFRLAELGVSLDQPETAARVVRDALGVSIREQFEARDNSWAYSLWLSAIENSGVLVFQMSRVPLAETRGFSIFEPESPVIVLNGADVPQAKSFTLFHELGHLLESSGGICGWTDDAAERRCNAFAADALMPGAEFLHELGDRDPIEAISDLASRFRVSREAAAVRLKVLGRLEQQDLDRIRQETADWVAENRQRASDREGGPPHHLIHLRNLGQRYVEAVLDAYQDDRITFADAAFYLDAKVPTIQRMEQALQDRNAS